MSSFGSPSRRVQGWSSDERHPARRAVLLPLLRRAVDPAGRSVGVAVRELRAHVRALPRARRRLAGMTSEHPWFLGRSELGNPSSALARKQPWTEGNSVTPLIHGATYFDRLAGALEPARSGDHLFLADWRGDDDERLRDGGPTLAELLCGLAARGVHVRGLL